MSYFFQYIYIGDISVLLYEQNIYYRFYLHVVSSRCAWYFRIADQLKSLSHTLNWHGSSHVLYMNLLVLLKIAWLNETLPTNCTLIWFLFCVDSQVLVQVTGLDKTFATNFTRMVFFSNVNMHMLGEIFWPSKAFITYFTLVLSLPCEMLGVETCHILYTDIVSLLYGYACDTSGCMISWTT